MQRANTASAIGRGGDAHVEGVGRGPLAGSLLAGGVEDDVDEGLLRDRILLPEDVRRDFDQEAVEDPPVPFGEDGAHLRGLEAQEALHQGVGLADHLHVAVLDPVVDHLHVVAGAVLPDVGGAGNAAHDGLARGRAGKRLAGLGVHLGRDRLPDRLQFQPGGEFAAGHERRAEARSLLAAGHAAADEAQALFAAAPSRGGSCPSTANCRRRSRCRPPPGAAPARRSPRPCPCPACTRITILRGLARLCTNSSSVLVPIDAAGGRRDFPRRTCRSFPSCG